MIYKGELETIPLDAVTWKYLFDRCGTKAAIRHRKVVLALTAAKSPSRLTRHLATPPAVSSIRGLRTPVPDVRRATFMGPAFANLHNTGLMHA
jgi:hypothetical protein